jgi:sugar lactone lactonase YvrE
MKKSALIAWVLFLSLFVIASSATAAEMTLFGPKQYVRTSGGPNVYSDTFQGALCRGKLIVRNGNSDGSRRVDDAVSSATVSLNGVQIFGPSDFNKQVYYLEAEVDLAESNSISATLASDPDSYLTIEVTRTAPPAITITNPVNNSTISSETPEITINYTNDEAGIDLASLSVKIDDTDHSADFTATDSKAKWRATSPFLPGAHAISASISDPKGNVGTAISNFTVAPSSQSIRYLFSIADNDWIFASPGDGTYREYLSGEDLGLFDAVDIVSLSEVLPNGTLFFTLSGQGGIFRSAADGSMSLYLGNAQLGLQDSDRILGLHIGLDGSVFFAAKGEPHIWASLGLSTRSLYLDQLARLGIDDSFQIECLHIGYDGTIYFCFSGGEGVYSSSGDGAYGQFLTPEALGVPGSRIDGFALVPDATAPGITVTDPPDGATIATRTPTIRIVFSDLESGLNLGSFAVTVNGEDWTSRFRVTSAEATYEVADPLPSGPYRISAQIKDNLGNTGTAVSNFTVSPPQPTVGITASPESIPSGGSATLAWSSTDATSVTIEPGIGPVPSTGSVTVSPGQTTTYTITATGPGGTVTAPITVTVTAANVQPLPEGSFGEQYQDLIPPDATVGSYDPKRFSLITGLVQDVTKAPIADVSVSILEYPKYGTALTDSNGRFSIPMDGGATYIVVYKKAGLISSQRKVYVPWNDTAVAPTIQMIAEDLASTTVTFNGDPATIVSHQSTPFTDEFGTRSCTMVFQGDNRAYEVDAQGNVLRELTAITTRATEFTTPESMPAILPPNSAYTYCAELSVDGVQRVRFEKPVITWVNNFLGFPVGAIVPVGYYDRDRGVWVPSDNGVVVQLLDTNGDGIVDALDATGSGQPTDLNGNGSFSDEVAGLGDPTKYPPGSTFWRFAVSHFSSWDCNWPFGPPGDAIFPNPEAPADVDAQECQDCDRGTGSFVEERSRILHEDIPIPGTDMTLHYASNRVGAYHYGITVPASGATVPASLEQIIVRVNIAGRTLEQVLDPGPNRTAEFLWDGLDQLGRRVVGSILAHIRVGFVYKAVYYGARNDLARAFAQAGSNITGIRGRQEAFSWKESDIVVSNPTVKGKGDIAESWTLSAHHFLSPADPSTLYKGDGTIDRNSISIITTVAGTETYGYNGDGGPAVDARLYAPDDMALDAAGNLYIADMYHHRIRKVDTSGIITTVTGNGVGSYSGDGGPAVNARLSMPLGVAVDAAGNLYIADSSNHRVPKVDTSGIITTVAGKAGYGYNGDGRPAVNALLCAPYSVALDAAGNLYIADMYHHRIRKVDTSGIISTVAATGAQGYSGDGGPAVNAHLNYPHGITVDPAGNLYITDSLNSRIRKVGPPSTFAAYTSAGDISFTDENGLGYIMSSAGLHKKTIDLDTGVVLREFGYNSSNQLVSITDRFGNETVIERGPDGVPTAIVSPDGLRTGLTVDANNHLTRITYPD